MLSRPAAELENQIKLTQNVHEHELTQLKWVNNIIFNLNSYFLIILILIFFFFRKFTPLTTPSSTVLPIAAINKETEITVPLNKHTESNLF